MEETNRGRWFQTYTGKAFYHMDPRPEEICIEDIAHALANTCRFNGHCKKYYSVAQHSVLVSHLLGEYAVDMGVLPGIVNAYALGGLLHDAAEAYCGDMVRPLKHEIPLYKFVENRILDVILKKFGVGSLPDNWLKADNVALATEVRDLLATPPMPWSDTVGMKPLLQKIVPLSPKNAEVAFLQRFNDLTGGVK
jgi:uncharacterized protein